jgi:hypothetical protein
MRVTVKDIHSASNLNDYAAYGDLFSVRYLIRPLSFHIAALFATLSISRRIEIKKNKKALLRFDE